MKASKSEISYPILILILIASGIEMVWDFITSPFRKK